MLKPVITILLYLFTPMLFGQSLINMKHYSVQDGLSQKNVHNFIQDDNGYIWMSTWNGLERFDGYSFYNYKTYPESPIRISNHRFTKIKKSSLNNIWCLTYDKRCYSFNTRTYEYQDPFLFNKSLTNSVSKLYALGKGITWAVGMQNELYRIDENKFPATESVELYSGRNERDTIYGITQDKDGDEWILTNKGALIVGQKSISNLMPFEFMVEVPGGIYLATSKGFFTRYDTQSQDVLPCVPEQPISEITGLKSLADNKIVILQNRSIILYDPANEKFTVHEMPIEIDSDVFEDKKGNLWLLGVNDGVILLDKENKNTTLLNYPRYSEVPFYKPCTFVHEDEYGCIWLKPAGGELCFYNPVNRCLEQASTYEMGMRKPVSFQAFSYVIDRHQNLWYTKGDGFGYLSFHRKKFEYRFDNHKEARALMEDHQKRLWVGWKRNHKKQSSNVCLYDPSGQWIGNLSREGKIVPDPTVTFNIDVYCIYEDKEHNIWLGTKDNGLYLLHPERDNSYRITHHLSDKNNPYSISSNSIYSILQDSAGRIWIGIITILAAASTINTVYASVSRIVQGMGEEGMMPSVFAKTNKRGAAWVGLVVLFVFVAGIIASGLGATEGVSFLLLSGSCFWLLTYCLVHVTVLILRKRNPEYPRKKWLTLGGIPQIIGILGNVYMIWNISTGDTRIKIFELCGV